MDNKTGVENLRQQLQHKLSLRFNAFGSQGSYNKPKYTKAGKLSKGRIFTYPHKNDLLTLWQLVKTDLETDTDHVTKQVILFINRTQDDYIKFKKEGN